MIRCLLVMLAFAALTFAVTPLGRQRKTSCEKADRSTPEVKSNPAVVIPDSAVRQAQLKRAFEAFRQRLTVLAGRLENGSDKDKEKAKALKQALKMASEQGTEAKFDTLIRELNRKGADQS